LTQRGFEYSVVAVVLIEMGFIDHEMVDACLLEADTIVLVVSGL